jgi:flagellar hook-associated protein FlgK
MYQFDVGLSAIRASQVGLRTTSNNLANAATPGYHRQQVILEDNLPATLGGLQLGTGVSVARVQRLVDSAIEAAILRNRSVQSEASARLSLLNRLDSLLTPGDGSLADETTRLFDALEQLASRPNEAVLQRQVVASAQGVTRELNSALAEIRRLQEDARNQTEIAVRELTQLSADIAAMNRQIQIQQAQGREPNDLLDRRDALVTRLAELVDLAPGGFPPDGSPLPGAAGALLFGAGPVELRVELSDAGQLQLRSPDWEAPIVPASGKLAALLEVHNQTLAGLRHDLLSWFEPLRQGLDQLQATGLGLTGGYTRLEATRATADPSVRLAAFAADLPLTAGELFITLTDKATGNRTTHRVAIDPMTHSLNDVAALLDAIPGLTAVVPPATGRLVIATAAGYEFDFAGRLDQQPTPDSVSGTAAALVGGLYTGSKNAQWEVVALDSGTVGVTAPLRLEVRDVATGVTLKTIDVGLGYEAGRPLSLPDGVTWQFSPGTIQAGDRWTLTPLAQPDQTGLLSALGLGSFFTGGPQDGFAVHPDLAAHPSRLAVSRTGLTGDAGNLLRMISLRNASPYGQPGETIEGRLAGLISGIGLETQFTRGEVDQLTSVGARLTEDRDALSGVDPNEEMLALLRWQQGFQAATRFISIIQATMDDLLKILA